ncbi:MAG: hypothetical protein M3396_08125 [Actinomycetota bacterium]|nr:hypothetical protein [Actinomycetota bacterium]MDQ3574160.1 hypothetical protein [Actinomycetota bacterium]
MSARLITITGALVALGLSSCGGTSKADYAKRADPVCSATNGELSAVAKPANLKQLGESSAKVAAATDKQVKALRQLDQPKEDRRDLDNVLASMDGTVAAAKKVETAAAGDDGRTVEAGVAELRQATTKADDAARNYGLTQCGRGGRDAATSLADGSIPALKQQLLTKADAICKDARPKIEAVPKPKNPAEAVRWLDQLLAVFEKAAADLKALHVPQADKAAYDEYLTAADQQTSAVRDLRAAVAANDKTRVNQVSGALESAAAESARKAAAVGLKDCAFEE